MHINVTDTSAQYALPGFQLFLNFIQLRLRNGNFLFRLRNLSRNVLILFHGRIEVFLDDAQPFKNIPDCRFGLPFFLLLLLHLSLYVRKLPLQIFIFRRREETRRKEQNNGQSG